MAPRFIAISVQGPAPPCLAAAFDRAVTTFGLDPVLTDGGLLAAASAGCPRHLFPGGTGILLGRAFSRATGLPAPQTLIQDEAERIRSGGPSFLLGAYWGSYLAIVRGEGPESGFILRDPSGLLPCYAIEVPGALLLVSDARLAQELGLFDATVDWDNVFRGLLHPDLRLEETALRSCRELLPGMASNHQGNEITLAWAPGTGSPRRSDVGDFHAAAARLRETVQGCVSAWAGERDHLLLELSGGLDSSILAACLKRAGVRFSCVTMVTPTPDGDERTYASMVAQHVGAPLIVRHYDPLAIDFGRSAAANLPRPCARAMAQGGDRALLEVASEIGADAFVGGGGGDNVFCYLGSASPAADRLLASGPGPGFWRSVADVAAVHETTFWQAGRRAIRGAISRRAGRTWPTDERLLGREALARAAPPAPHPWLRDSLLPPGKWQHVESIIAIQNHVEGFARAAQRPLLLPLLSQPVIELCLAIPSWRWNEGGINRSVARAAFADALPTAIVRRRTKGGLAGLAGALFTAHRLVIRELVLDGELMRGGYLDRVRAEELLGDEGSFSGTEFYRLLEIAEIEAWAATWR